MSAQPVETGPVIILVEPQLGENIGSAARAMLNCGLDTLRIVRPRDGWPNPAARANAVGAAATVDRATLHASTREAIADLRLVFAATARPRDLDLPVVPLQQACRELRELGQQGLRGGVLFGPEAAGLSSDDVSLANGIVSIPLSPRLGSLNLAHAVLLVAWEHLRLASDIDSSPAPPRQAVPTAQTGLVDGFLDHLEQELEAGGFFRVPESRAMLRQDIRSLFRRSRLTEVEVSLLHGVVTALSGRRKGGRLARTSRQRPPEPNQG